MRARHRAQLDPLASDAQRHDRLCELNVIEQVVNACRTTVVREAWARGQELAVHGWIYGVGDGLLRDLGFCVTSDSDLWASYETARTAVPS